MPLIAKRPTLREKLLSVFMTPFHFVLAMVISRRKLWAVLAVVVVILQLCGMPVFQEWMTRENLIIGACMVVFLWFVAIPLTIYDYFRYDGWMSDHDVAAIEVAGSFAHCVLFQDYDHAFDACSVSYQARHSATQFVSDAQRVSDGLGEHRQILKLDELGSFSLPILRGARKMLHELAVRETDAVGLVLLTNSRGEADPRNVPTLRVRLVKDGDVWKIDDFDSTKTSLNQ